MSRPLPSEVAQAAEDAASDENRPPDVARHYGLLAALDELAKRIELIAEASAKGDS